MNVRRTNLGAALSLLLFLGACADDLKPANQLGSVRILATQASESYAKPGERIALNALVVDARENKGAPVRTFFLAAPCVNPKNDDATECYARFRFPRGVDLTAMLQEGTAATVTIPDDAVRASDGYGVVFSFVMSCAGHIEYVGTSAAYPSAPPFGCFDAGGRRLGSDDAVFAFSRIYVQGDLRNANPTIDAVTVSGVDASEAQPFELKVCTTDVEADCPATAVDVRVAPSAQEDDVLASLSGFPAKEQITVQYFVTGGRMKNDASVVYDARSGRIAGDDNGIRAPKVAGDYTLYAVLRDNRGGVSWKSAPFRAR
jgi:hypothetical protein